MRVMVTGSDGYIGTGVVRQLLAANHEVVALGLTPSGLFDEKMIEFVGDAFTFDFSSVAKPDVLLHLAWRNGFSHRDISHLEDLPKHYSFIERALDAGITRVAVMGSMHEVGYYEGAVDEASPCNPMTPYGVAKNALRQLTGGLCQRYGATMQWLRGFYLVSNDGRGDSIFSKIVAAERRGDTTFPFTSGDNKYDFLPYDDFCRQVVATIEQERVAGIINICSGQPVAIGDYIEDFLKENHFKIKLAYGTYPDRPYDSPAIWGDNAKIRAILDARIFNE